MEKKAPTLKKMQNSYIRKVDGLLKSNAGFRSLLSYVQQEGDNFIAQKSREESKLYDEKWVDSLEEGFLAIDSIISNPRKFIKEREEVVISALAKRVTAASVRHLASHSEFVHGYDEHGNILPEKILSISSEEDLQIYENRFVMTLIMKLVVFIEKRYNFIKDHGETRDSDLLLVHSSTEINGVLYEVDSRIKASIPSKDNGRGEKNAALLAKISKLRERAVYYLHSPFMNGMAGAKPVHNPISQTNMLLKNPYYHKAYQLWKFIDSYTKLGVSYSIKEEEIKFDESYIKDIYSLVLGSMMTLYSRQVAGTAVKAPTKKKNKKLTPRVLLNLEDEAFQDDKFLYSDVLEKDKKSKNKMALLPDEAALKKKENAAKAKAEAEKAAKIAKQQALWREKQAEKEERELRERKERYEKELARRAAAEEAKKARLLAIKAKKEEAARKKALEEAKKEEERLLALLREKVKKEGLVDKSKETKLLKEKKIKAEERDVPFKGKEEIAIEAPVIESINKDTPIVVNDVETPQVLATADQKIVNKGKKESKPNKRKRVASLATKKAPKSGENAHFNKKGGKFVPNFSKENKDK